MTVMQQAQIIDGKALAKLVKQQTASRVVELSKHDHHVRLDAILVGNEGAASIYARNQGKMCKEEGIEYVLHELDGQISEQELVQLVTKLNAEPAVNAIMVHLPLPDHVDTEHIQALISPKKDVEGVNPANIGNIVYGRRSLVPCTALAVMEMIESTGVNLKGSRCVCVGASNIVGKPIVVLLMRDEATVISTNKYTPELAQITRSADILISATGVPELIRGDMVKSGAVVIDVGISRITTAEGQSRTVGDVAFDEVMQVAGYVSPVPGGVGPMTVAMLLRNTVDATERANFQQ